MNDRDALGLELRRTFQHEADGSVPDRLVDDVLALTAMTRPRAAWRVGWVDRLPRLPIDLPVVSGAGRLVVVGFLILALLGVALVVGGGLRSGGTPFSGRWTSTDHDGSHQVLDVAPGLEPRVTYVDEHAAVCANAGDTEVRYLGTGGGLVQGDMLTTRFPDAGCASYREHNIVTQYIYRSATDTLLDTFDITWYRVP